MESESCSVVSNSLRPHGLYRPRNSPGQNTGVGSLSLLQGIFPTQGWNPGLLHCRQILYQLSHKGRPRTLEWVAYPFSSGSSQPKNWTRSLVLQVDSWPTEVWGKPNSEESPIVANDTGVNSKNSTLATYGIIWISVKTIAMDWNTLNNLTC